MLKFFDLQRRSPYFLVCYLNPFMNGAYIIKRNYRYKFIHRFLYASETICPHVSSAYYGIIVNLHKLESLLNFLRLNFSLWYNYTNINK